ncbi:hypothetical protein CEXT_206291 [Caerostris extrusa]|uniref:Uncharacterized protein n=1 Tax=Caerostris extrusa TaxID=172846 RepID=A0AAV4QPA9_CAEEX|nr:hypothetical protein CEXT_206291 [Caerostris extrusa]
MDQILREDQNKEAHFVLQCTKYAEILGMHENCNILQQSTLTLIFSGNALFVEEITFTCDGVVNLHNSYVCATSNPHAFQEWFSFSVWADPVNDFLIGPYFSK